MVIIWFKKINIYSFKHWYAVSFLLVIFATKRQWQVLFEDKILNKKQNTNIALNNMILKRIKTICYKSYTDDITVVFLDVWEHMFIFYID